MTYTIIKQIVMCLILEKDSVKTIAYTDIIVYKVVTRVKPRRSNVFYRSLYYNFDYYKDVLYCGELHQTVSPYSCNWIIENGFHSYARLEDAMCIAEDYYSIVKCIIPAGSEFYKGHGVDFTQQYASNKIVIKEEVRKSPFNLLSNEQSIV